MLGSINPFLASKTHDELEQLVHDLAELDLLLQSGVANRAGQVLSRATPRTARDLLRAPHLVPKAWRKAGGRYYCFHPF